jgi:hypothetical protein
MSDGHLYEVLKNIYYASLGMAHAGIEQHAQAYLNYDAA